jgi:rubredoxin
MYLLMLRFKLIRIRENREPPVPGLYKCRACGWTYFHPEPDRWSNVFIIEDGTMFRPLDKLQYSSWEDWSNEQADCVRGLVRIVG